MFLALLTFLAAGIGATGWVAWRWFTTREPLRKVIADGLVLLVSRVRDFVWSLVAFRDRKIISGETSPADHQMTAPPPRPPAGAPVARREVAPPPPYQDAPANAAGEVEIAEVMNAPIPPHWRAVIGATADFEPEDWRAHLAWLAGEAAGVVGYAESVRMQCEIQLAVIGLDPSAVQAVLDFADAVSDCAHDAVLAKRLFIVIYQEILAWAENGGKLPHNAREWLSGDAA